MGSLVTCRDTPSTILTVYAGCRKTTFAKNVFESTAAIVYDKSRTTRSTAALSGGSKTSNKEWAPGCLR